MARRVAWLLSLLMLIATGVVGTYNGLTEWKDAHTGLQRTVTGGVFLYGLLGILSAYGLLRRRSWSRSSTVAWGIVVTYVAATAALAYAPGAATLGGAVAAGLASALIAAAVVWTARISTRTETVPATTSVRSDNDLIG